MLQPFVLGDVDRAAAAARRLRALWSEHAPVAGVRIDLHDRARLDALEALIPAGRLGDASASEPPRDVLYRARRLGRC